MIPTIGMQGTEARLGGQDWLPAETNRMKRAGTRIGFRGVVNEYRADLSERCAMACMKTIMGHLDVLDALAPLVNCTLVQLRSQSILAHGSSETRLCIWIRFLRTSSL